MKKILTTTLIMMIVFSVQAQTDQTKEDVLRTIQEFETAIVESDSAKAAYLLHDNALILEGRVETKEEYLSAHFFGDGRFLRNMSREPIFQDISVHGETAWVTSITRFQGTFRDQDHDLNSMQLMVLKHTDNGWKIASVHWSSRPNQ